MQRLQHERGGLRLLARLQLQPAAEVVHGLLRVLARAAAAPVVAGVGAGERRGERVVCVDVSWLEGHRAPGEDGCLLPAHLVHPQAGEQPVRVRVIGHQLHRPG